MTLADIETRSTDMLRPPAGNFDNYNADGLIAFSNEGQLRDGITATAWLAGWDVATEVSASNGGRADIVLSAPGAPMVVVELKVNLRTARQFRLGFQQADGYRRSLGRTWGDGCAAYLVAAHVDWTLAAGYTRDYPKVHLEDVPGLLQQVEAGLSLPSVISTLRARSNARLAGIHKVAGVATEIGAWRARQLRSGHLHRLRHQYPAMADMLTAALERAA